MIDPDTPVCDKCGSTSVKIIADHKSDRPYFMLGHYLAHCAQCGEQCILTESQGLQLLTAQTLGHSITDLHPCPKCGHNLQGLRIGDTCPSCKTQIWTAATAPATTIRKPLTAWNWLSLVILLGILAIYIMVTTMKEAR